MASKTFSGNGTTAITLSSAYNYNPFYVTGTLNVAGSDALDGDNSQAWTIVNQGTIESGSTNGDGIHLAAGGSVSNRGTAALIQGPAGVYILGAAGRVSNSGTIDGTSGYGVRLNTGGSVSNTAGLIEGGAAGIDILGDTGTVTNAGTIEGTGTSAFGVILGFGGSVTNDPSGAGSALIEGYGAIAIENATGTVSNSGTIEGTGTGAAGGVLLFSGGSVMNGPSGAFGALIEGYRGIDIQGGSGTVSNSGTIEGTGTGAAGGGVLLFSGGSVTNGPSGASGALIEGYRGIEILGGSGTVSNSGTIEGTGAGGGVLLFSGGSVTNGPSGASGALIEGYRGIDILGGSGTVSNSGTIEGTGTSGLSGGVLLFSGGNVTNGSSDASGALIEGGQGGIGIYTGGAGTVSNSGTIISTGTSGSGVELALGGSVINGPSGAAGALIEGYHGVEAVNAAGTVTNSGMIVGTGSSGFGVLLSAGGTVIDSGTISGSGSVYFGGTGGNLLVLQHGYKLVGSVAGSGTAGATNTLQLGGSLGAAVTVGYNGLGLTNFQDVLFGAGGYDTLKVSNISGALPVTISGFDSTSDTINLTTIGTNGSIAGQSSTQLTIAGSGGTVTLQLDGSDAAAFLVSSDGTAGIDLSPSCFCSGTRILTEDGEVAVEDLSIGDEVVTFSGEAKPIKWIGRRAYDGHFIAGNRQVLPIRIAAGAIADGVPARELLVSPEHALYLDEQFLPARLLVNGVTIRPVETVSSLEYFHIELDGHDVIFAEGAAAETFVDVGGRAVFHNGAEFAALYPAAAPADCEAYWALLEEGAARLPRVRAALLNRAEELGQVSGEPDLYLMVDGDVVRAHSVIDRVHHFVIPADAQNVTIASRSVVPRDTEAASLDTRRLGVPLERVLLTAQGARIEIGPDCPALCDGFHEGEGSHRWTNGMGMLPRQFLACLIGEIALAVHLSASDLDYPLAAASALPCQPTAVERPVAQRERKRTKLRSGRGRQG